MTAVKSSFGARAWAKLDKWVTVLVFCQYRAKLRLKIHNTGWLTLIFISIFPFSACFDMLCFVFSQIFYVGAEENHL